MQALHQAQAAGTRFDPEPDDAARQRRSQALRSKPWVVYAKTPLAGPAAVLDYLSHYAHRTAIPLPALRQRPMGGDRLSSATAVQPQRQRRSPWQRQQRR